jgi:hypothetical protein
MSHLSNIYHAIQDLKISKWIVERLEKSKTDRIYIRSFLMAVMLTIATGSKSSSIHLINQGPKPPNPKIQSDNKANQNKWPLLYSNEPERVYPTFNAAFSAVFIEGKTLFVHVRRGKPNDQAGNYLPTISISDSSAVPANVFHRNTEWAFRFTTEDLKENADRRYAEIDNMITATLNRNGIQFVKTIYPFDHGDTSIGSYEYKDKAQFGYRILFTRFTGGNTVYEEVIIYHSQYAGSL